jgi:hypothetical protein
MPRRRTKLNRWPKGKLIRRLDDERRELIDSAPTELVERDGRVYTLRKLPSAQ